MPKIDQNAAVRVLVARTVAELITGYAQIYAEPTQRMADSTMDVLIGCAIAAGSRSSATPTSGRWATNMQAGKICRRIDP